MQLFSEDDFRNIKEWFIEWSRFPKYLATVSLAFLAFSFTELLPKMEEGSVAFLFVVWVLLGCSALFSFVGMLGAYISFDLACRLHLADSIKKIRMRHPLPDTPWIARWGKVSFDSTALAALLLLLAALFLGLHVGNSVRFEEHETTLRLHTCFSRMAERGASGNAPDNVLYE